MFRIPLLLIIFVLSLTVLSCQSYTTGLQQSVTRADETAATAALHTVATAQRTYAAANDGNYGNFQQLTEGGYLDERFSGSTPTIKDYVLTMAVTPRSEAKPEGFFSCKADPLTTGGKTGRHFYIDSASSGLHVNPSESATANDPIAQP